jgi:hypothetical protein
MDNVEIAAIYKTLGDGADTVARWCDEGFDYLAELRTQTQDVEKALCLYIDLMKMAQRVRTAAWSRQKDFC